jgi:hypothetical protein
MANSSEERGQQKDASGRGVFLSAASKTNATLSVLNGDGNG